MSEPINKIVFQDKDTSNTGNQEFYLPTGFRDKVKKDGATFQSYYTNENGVRKAVINGDWLVENSACDVNKGYIKYQGTDNYFRVIACYADPSLIKGQFTTNKNDSTVYYPFFKKGYEGSSRPIESSELHSFPGFKTATRGYEIINNKLYIKTNFVWPSSCLSGLIGEGSDNGAYFFQYAGDNSNNHTKTYILLNKTNYNIQTIDEVSVINDSSNGRITLSYKPTIKYSAIDSQINDLTISTASFTLETIPSVYSLKNWLHGVGSNTYSNYVNFYPRNPTYSGDYNTENTNILSFANSTYTGRAGYSDDLFGVYGMTKLSGIPSSSGTYEIIKKIDNKQYTLYSNTFSLPSKNMSFKLEASKGNILFCAYKDNEKVDNIEVYGSKGGLTSNSYIQSNNVYNINGEKWVYVQGDSSWDLVPISTWTCRTYIILDRGYARGSKLVSVRLSQPPAGCYIDSLKIKGYSDYGGKDENWFENDYGTFYNNIEDGYAFTFLWPFEDYTDYFEASITYYNQITQKKIITTEQNLDSSQVSDYVLKFRLPDAITNTSVVMQGTWYQFANTSIQFGISDDWYESIETYGSNYSSYFHNSANTSTTKYTLNNGLLDTKEDNFPCRYITIKTPSEGGCEDYYVFSVDYKKILMWSGNAYDSSTSGGFTQINLNL